MPSGAFTTGEKSMLTVKDSKNGLILLLEAIKAGDFKLKLVLIYHSPNPRILKNYVNSTLPMLCKWNDSTSIIIKV